MKTITICANIGVYEGYGHNNAGNAADFGALLQKICGETMEVTGIYPSFVVSPTKTIYHTDWGCPVGGEDTFDISATFNPLFAPAGKTQEEAFELFRTAAMYAIRKLKKELRQTTVSVLETEIEFKYLSD